MCLSNITLIDDEWDFSSNIDFPSLLKLFRKADKEIHDLHVICETLKYKHEYTGDREWLDDSSGF